MHGLSQLDLVNFRSHRKSQLRIDRRPVVLTGANGAGKTNILEAISLFTAGRGLRRAERTHLARAPEQIGWKLSLQGHMDNQQFQIETSAKIHESRNVWINEKQAPQSRMSDYLRLVWMVPSQDRIWIDSASDRRRFFDRIVFSLTPQHGDSVSGYERAMRERNRLIKDGVRDDHWYVAIEAKMAECSEKIVENRARAIEQLNGQMTTSISAFPPAELSLNYMDPTGIPENWREYFAQRRGSDFMAGTTRLGPHRVEFNARYIDKNQPAALCSTGEQKALLISLFMAISRALQSNGALTMLLLDEVVAHLDEDRRAALFDELCALDAQIAMTGTEAQLFEALGKRGVHWLVNGDEDGSTLTELG